jgi:hypothetical protein
MAVLASTEAFAPSGRLSRPSFAPRGRTNEVSFSLSLPVLDIFDSGDPSDAVMREFEKKEAVMQKRREDAQTKLIAYEETLEKLRNRKAEYVAGQQLAEPPVGGSFSETALRSVVKAFLWRVIAGSVRVQCLAGYGAIYRILTGFSWIGCR